MKKKKQKDKPIKFNDILEYIVKQHMKDKEEDDKGKRHRTTED